MRTTKEIKWYKELLNKSCRSPDRQRTPTSLRQMIIQSNMK